MNKKITIIGSGSMGTALSVLLANNGYSPVLWDVDKALLEDIARTGMNNKYLPGEKLHEAVSVAFEEAEALENAELVVFAVPTKFFESAFKTAVPLFDGDPIVVNAAKGIEQKSLRRMSEIAKEIKPDVRYVVLSGPSHAEEIIKLMPTTITAASDDSRLAHTVQEVFTNDSFRIYVNDDVVGVELGGALKNIIALGAGIADGMGFGDNAKAALMTRGMVEMARLGVRLGANPDTFFGLTGVGDLIVTCCSMHSRNRRCGILIGQGTDPKEAAKEVGMIVEGMFSADAAYRLSQQLGVDMPITAAIYNIIYNGKNVHDAAAELLAGSRKRENEDLFRPV